MQLKQLELAGGGTLTVYLRDCCERMPNVLDRPLVLVVPGGGYTHVEWMLDNLLTGGLLLGAFFMATDYSTSPVTAPGRIIYGVGCGALTVLIRVFGGFPEGVSFAILIMNCCAWMFDKHTQRRQFGVSREDVKAKKAAAKAAKKEAKEAAANG